jgi:hypothetical protein
MKKNFITILLFTLILTACGAAASTQTGNPDGGTNGNNSSFGSTPLPLAMELVVGTFKLEGTDNAVTADQAAKLLPLWQVYKDLSASSSAAQEEIDALASQIQETMTPAQIQSITDMKLTRREVFQTMQDLGIATGRPNASGTPRPGGGNGFGGGGVPGGGGPPGSGQGFNNGQNLSPQQIATFQARRAQNGGGSGQFNRIPPALYDALIKLLQNKK